MMVPLYALVFLLTGKIYILLLLSPMALLILAGTVVTTSLVMPLTFTWILYRRKVISSFSLSQTEDRTIPIVVTAVFYYLLFYLMKQVQMLPSYYIFILCLILLMLCALLVNLRWKISLYMLGAGALTAFIAGMGIKYEMNVALPLTITLVLSGLSGTFRLLNDKHSPAQVYAGFISGFVTVFWVYTMI